MTDDLDGKTDGELNELFAVEVAGWIGRPLPFCTDANAVLDRGCHWNVCFRDTPGKVFLTLWTLDGKTCVAEADGRSFAHAYVKAILRAKRAKRASK